MRENFKRSRVLSIMAAVQVLQLVLVSGNHDPMGRTMNDCTLTIDVRRPADYWQGHLDCSLNFPRPNIVNHMPEILALVSYNTSKPVKVHCYRGIWAGEVKTLMENTYGFADVENRGGWNTDYAALQTLCSELAADCPSPSPTPTPTPSPTPSPTACEDTFVFPPSQTEEGCAATAMARFTKQCHRRPNFASGYLDVVWDGLSATGCADLCLSRFSCRSFTHIESSGRCHLYAKPYKGPAYHQHHATKNLYRLIPCTPECPTSSNIMDRYTRAAAFRTVTVTCVDDGNGGETCTTTLAYPAVDPTSGVYEGGYRPKHAGAFTVHCTTEACATLAGCAQACFDSGTTGAGACKSFNFKTDDGTQCKFYRKAYVPTYLVEHGTKQYYHLTVRSNCIPAS